LTCAPAGSKDEAAPLPPSMLVGILSGGTEIVGTGRGLGDLAAARPGEDARVADTMMADPKRNRGGVR
jgi:hypothetical protein